MVAEPLRLVALDAEDLDIFSAHLQDAVLRVADLTYLPAEQRFALIANRFNWEASDQAGKAGRTQPFERRRSALHFERVQKVEAQGISRSDKDAVLELLAIRFEQTEAPAGHVDLIFAGGATVRLTVECVEARLKDLGAAWQTKSRPDHDLGEAALKEKSS
jgi:hypothetical protein